MRHIYPGKFIDRPPTTWPVVECIPPETLVKLILYQWKHYGTRLKVLDRMLGKKESGELIESLEEIDQMMRQPTKYRRPPG